MYANRFGVFGSSLILARQLMQDNETTELYRRGQAPSRGLDKVYQLRASTPNYLKSTPVCSKSVGSDHL